MNHILLLSLLSYDIPKKKIKKLNYIYCVGSCEQLSLWQKKKNYLKSKSVSGCVCLFDRHAIERQQVREREREKQREKESCSHCKPNLKISLKREIKKW